MARHDRIAEEIKKEVSNIIHDEIKDPRIGFVTITGVELAPDYRFVRISYSVLGSDDDYKKTKAALDSSLGFIRKLIGERIRLRFTPEIAFREDKSTEYSVQIEKILNQIKEEDESKKNSPRDKKAQ